MTITLNKVRNECMLMKHSIYATQRQIENKNHNHTENLVICREDKFKQVIDCLNDYRVKFKMTANNNKVWFPLRYYDVISEILQQVEKDVDSD